MDFYKGLLVRELKEFLSHIEDYALNGEPTEVWIETSEGFSSPVHKISLLDRSDIMLS